MKFIINELEKRFGRKIVLSNITYTFESGKVYGIYGAEKSGKTTLIDCIRGHLPFKYGTVDIEDGEDEDKVFEMKDVGMIHAAPVLPEFMTAYEFIRFFLDINEDKVHEMLPIDTYFDSVGIGMDERYRLIRDLNPDTAYIVQLLCFAILPTKVIIAENPKVSSDEVRREMKMFLSKLSRDSVVIVVSDDEELVDFYCDEKAVLKDGVLYGPSAFVDNNGNLEDDNA